LQKALPDIQALGAQVVAISPEKPDNSLLTTHKNRLDYRVLSDVNSEVARKFGVSFTLPSNLKKLYRTFGLNLEKYNGARTVELPMPATFLIDTQQVVQYAFADEDYTQRADTEEILQALAALKHEECVYC
jgi:peroxiredoxin